MRKTCSLWVSNSKLKPLLPYKSRWTATVRNNGNALAAMQLPASSVKTAVRKSPNLSRQQVVGNAGAALRLPVNSVRSAVLPSRRTQTAGPAPAVQSTKENSVRTVVRKNRKEHRYTAVTSADGSRRIRRTLPSSALNAVISLMTATSNNAMIGNIIRKDSEKGACKLAPDGAPFCRTGFLSAPSPFWVSPAV